MVHNYVHVNRLLNTMAMARIHVQGYGPYIKIENIWVLTLAWVKEPVVISTLHKRVKNTFLSKIKLPNKDLIK